MSEVIHHDRRRFLGIAVMTTAAAKLVMIGATDAQSSKIHPSDVPMITPGSHTSFGPLKQIDAGVLNVGDAEAGPADGPAVMLLHGWPYDIHSYVNIAPMLAAHGCRVIVPHLRGHGTTRFLDSATPRSGQQASLVADVIALMDALSMPRAALWPERCTGLVSVNSYLIQDIAKAALPLPAKIEAGFWYQYYWLTERGRAGLMANRRDIARIMWTRNSPHWHFDDATFDRSATAFDNPDYVDVVIHSYRHRLGFAAGYPPYEEIEKRLATQPAIMVPTITLDGDADGVVPATDGQSTAAKFAGERQHRVIPNGSAVPCAPCRRRLAHISFRFPRPQRGAPAPPERPGAKR